MLGLDWGKHLLGLQYHQENFRCGGTGKFVAQMPKRTAEWV